VLMGKISFAAWKTVLLACFLREIVESKRRRTLPAQAVFICCFAA